MNPTVTVAGASYPYRFEKHAEDAYFIKVSTLTVGKVWKAKDEWTAHVRAACTYAHALSEVEGFASREAAAKYILRCYETVYSKTGSQTPDQVASVLHLVGDIYEPIQTMD